MEHYSEAAVRHWRDAQFLETDRRLENADQLLALATECAIKAALLFSVAPGVLSAVPYKHLDAGLWEKAALQLNAKRYPGLHAVLKLANPFANWAIAQRYYANGCITPEVHASHKQAARRVLGAIGLLAVK